MVSINMRHDSTMASMNPEYGIEQYREGYGRIGVSHAAHLVIIGVRRGLLGANGCPSVESGRWRLGGVGLQ